MPSFDPRPLTEPVDKNAVREFGRVMRAQAPAGGTRVVTIVLMAVIGIFVLGVFSTIAVSAITIMVSSFSRLGAGGAVVGIVPILLIAGAIVLITLTIVRTTRGRTEKLYRLDRFARANGMTFLPRLNGPQLPGMIFGVGSSRHSLDLVRGERPRFVEFANYRYTTGSGKNQTTHRWGYVAVKLDVPLPHIILDALSNNGLFGSNLPFTPGREQRLSLEGDFDRHFALYCPSGYERDALYLFTPDIMARFIDNAAALDVEIVDDWLFLYARRDFSTLDPATWAWLFSVVGALLDKFAQWGRWRDDRLRAEALAASAGSTVQAATGVPSNAALPAPGSGSVPFEAPHESLRPPPGVAEPGRRLRRGVPWPAIVVIVAIAIVWLIGPAQIFGSFFGR